MPTDELVWTLQPFNPSIVLFMFLNQLIVAGRSDIIQLLHNMELEDKFVGKGTIFVFRVHFF